MRRIAAIAVAACVCGAQPAQAGPSAGGLSSDEVEYVDTVPLPNRAVGGRLVGKYYYLTTGADLRIFDASDAENPRLVGQLALDLMPDVHYYATGYQEDVDTNGKVLLRAGQNQVAQVEGLQVVDVQDPTNPVIIATLDDVFQHTITCILDCTWAYGSEGAIIDLRNPTQPQVAGDWLEPTGTMPPHDVTEVAPGIVLTSGSQMLLLDARSDPTAPTQLALTEMPSSLHGNLWPNTMTDDLVLAGGENLSLSPDCWDSPHARLYTLDSVGWQASQTFRLIDEFSMQAGAPTDGRLPASRFCTHWFDAHPAFRNGGLVAMATSEPGTRFLKVGTAGQIEEVGWFLPYAGFTWESDWITDRIVYAVDYNRGIDILRWTGEIPAGRPSTGQPAPTGPQAPARSPSFADLVRMTPNRRCVTPRSLRVTVRRGALDTVSIVTLRVNGRRVLSRRGKRLARPLRLRALPRRRFMLQVEVRTRRGHKTAGQASYRPCRS